ncbi:MAG: type II toxin-antitoxin system VapC family toxin [Dietzia sp.]
MTVLLDTHLILWWMSGSPGVGPRTRSLLSSSSTRYCSAVSIWEIALKKSKGKLDVVDGFEDQIPSMGMTHLPIDATHAAAVSAVSLPHRDPFDQLLVAQAQVDGLRLLTADAAILSAGLPFVMDART